MVLLVFVDLACAWCLSAYCLGNQTMEQVGMDYRCRFTDACCDEKLQHFTFASCQPKDCLLLDVFIAGGSSSQSSLQLDANSVRQGPFATCRKQPLSFWLEPGKSFLLHTKIQPRRAKASPSYQLLTRKSQKESSVSFD